MNDMRFNNASDKNVGDKREQTPAPDSLVKTGSFRKALPFQKIFKFASILIIIGLLAMFGYFASRSSFGKSSKINNDAYHAVFLTNGQVYFGKIADKNRGEIVLQEVFYLQTTESGAEPQGPSFNLVKLGQELHGPQNKMSINMDHIIFYEELRDDSQVVSSIKNLK